MKQLNKYWLVFITLIIIACNSGEDEYTIIYENTQHRENSIMYESGRLIRVDDVSVDVSIPIMISLLDDSIDTHRWLNMEAETYCESYDIVFKVPEYKHYPYALRSNFIKYRDKKENVHKLDISDIAEAYSDGFILIKPEDTTPVFMPQYTSSIHFDAPVAEAYYQFTYDDDNPDNINYTAEDYVRMFSDMKKTINKTYNFNDITIQMGSRNFDLELETGLSNHSIVEAFYTFKYMVENDQPEMIAHNMVSYPLKVIAGNDSYFINSPKAFVKEYNRIVKKELKNTIEKSTVFNLTPDKAGFMLNDGDVYFKNQKQEIRITVIRKK